MSNRARLLYISRFFLLCDNRIESLYLLVIIVEMACAALKRPHNFDLLASPQRISGSPKRRRCGTAATAMTMSSSPTSISPFLDATPKLSRGMIVT